MTKQQQQKPNKYLDFQDSCNFGKIGMSVYSVNRFKDTEILCLETKARAYFQLIHFFKKDYPVNKYYTAF